MSHPSTPRPFCVAAPQETPFFNSAAFYSSTSIASSISTWCSLTITATFNLLPCVDDFQYPCFSSSVQLLALRHCSPHTSRPAVGTALSVLLIVSCCWVCSSRLFVQLSEILVDLLLVVVQILRLCAPFRQSGGASLVDFFSPLALWLWFCLCSLSSGVASSRHYCVVVYCSEVGLSHLQRHYSALRRFVIIGSR